MSFDNVQKNGEPDRAPQEVLRDQHNIEEPDGIPQAVRDQLLADIEREPTRWPQEPGDRIVGTLIDRSLQDTNRGDSVEVLRIEDKEGVEEIWCSPKVLKRLVREKDPRVGDYVAVKYLGEAESRNGFSYKRFNLPVIPPNRAGSGSESGGGAPVAPAISSSEQSLGVSDADLPF